MDGEDKQLCLKWHNFKENFMSQFEYLKDEEDFVDVTLSCGGRHLRAHKVVLSASSPYLKAIFKENPCKHPVIILDDMSYSHLEALLAFVYTGQVNVSEAELPAFLDSANLLEIRGLSDTNLSTTEGSNASTVQTPCTTTATRKRSIPPALDSAHSSPKVHASRRISRPLPDHESKKEENLSEGEVAEYTCQQTENERHVKLPEWDQDIAQGDVKQRPHSLDARICPLCNRRYSNLSNLRQHVRLIHNPQGVRCKLCSRDFKTDLYLRRHIISYHENGLASDSGGGALPNRFDEIESTNLPHSISQ